MEDFSKWCIDKGFYSLRIRKNVYWNDNGKFLEYINELESDKELCEIIQSENTPDSRWCRLSLEKEGLRGFFVFMLQGVENTYECSPGIEYIVGDDGNSYIDYDKTFPVKDYKLPLGLISDRV